MALNGLEANPSKTEFILLNNKQKEQSGKIKVGTAEVQETRSAKLLGITMDNDQNWNSHFWGKKGDCYKHRLFVIRRILNHIPKDKLKHVVNIIWMSKLRY